MELPVHEAAEKKLREAPDGRVRLPHRRRTVPGVLGTCFWLKNSNHTFPQIEAVQLETISFCPGEASLTQRIGNPGALRPRLGQPW